MSASAIAAGIFDAALGILPPEVHPYLLPVRGEVEKGIGAALDAALDAVSVSPTVLAMLLKLAEQFAADLKTKHVKVSAGAGATVSFTILPPKD